MEKYGNYVCKHVVAAEIIFIHYAAPNGISRFGVLVIKNLFNIIILTNAIIYNIIIIISKTVMNWKRILILFSILLSYLFAIVNPATTRMFTRKWNQRNHIREQTQKSINCIHKPSLIHKGHPPCRPIRNYNYKLMFNRS